MAGKQRLKVWNGTQQVATKLLATVTVRLLADLHPVLLAQFGPNTTKFDRYLGVCTAPCGAPEHSTGQQGCRWPHLQSPLSSTAPSPTLIPSPTAKGDVFFATYVAVKNFEMNHGWSRLTMVSHPVSPARAPQTAPAPRPSPAPRPQHPQHPN